MSTDTNAFGNEIISHYLNLQKINQNILDSNYSNPVTREILAKHINHPEFGSPGINLEKKIESDNAHILSSAAVFAFTGLFTGSIAIAAPIAVLSHTLIGSSVVKSIYKNLNENREVIYNAAEFYFNNHESLGTSFHDGLFLQIKNRDKLTNQAFLKTYIRLFKFFHGEIFNVPDYIPEQVKQNESSHAKRDITVELAINEDNEKSLLIISDDILANELAMNDFTTVKGSIGEIELLSTISHLEKSIQNDTYGEDCDLVKIETIILPKLREALNFQSLSEDDLT